MLCLSCSMFTCYKHIMFCVFIMLFVCLSLSALFVPALCAYYCLCPRSLSVVVKLSLCFSRSARAYYVFMSTHHAIPFLSPKQGKAWFVTVCIISVCHLILEFMTLQCSVLTGNMYSVWWDESHVTHWMTTESLSVSSFYALYIYSGLPGTLVTKTMIVQRQDNDTPARSSLMSVLSQCLHRYRAEPAWHDAASLHPFLNR